MPRNNSSLLGFATPARWMLIPALASLLVGMATAPAWLPAWAQALVTEAFAPFCHQLPERVPHIQGTALAVCDRCIGIYSGGLLGGLLAGVVPAAVWASNGSIRSLQTRIVLSIGLAPALVDWLGPWLNLWPNTPSSRLATGLWLGGVVAWVVVRAIRSASPHTH